MVEFCNKKNMSKDNENNMFEILTIIKVSKANISNLLVHKGAAPNVEIQCFDQRSHDDPKSKDKYCKIVIKFMGDMERQAFIDDIANSKLPNDDQEDDIGD